MDHYQSHPRPNVPLTYASVSERRPIGLNQALLSPSHHPAITITHPALPIPLRHHSASHAPQTQSQAQPLSPAEQAWIQREMQLHPMPPGMPPKLWYEWRMRVRMGASEEEAWQWCAAMIMGQQQQQQQQHLAAMRAQTEAEAHAGSARGNAAAGPSTYAPSSTSTSVHGGVQVKTVPGTVSAPQVNGIYSPVFNQTQVPLQIKPEPTSTPQSTIAPSLIHRSSAPPALHIVDAHLENIPSPLSSIQSPHETLISAPARGLSWSVHPDNALHPGAPIKKWKRNRDDSSSLDPPPPTPKASPTKAKYAAASRPAVPHEITWPYIQSFLTAEEFRKEKPVPLWSNLRDQHVDGGVQAPKFVPDPDQLRAIAVALRNAPQLYLQNVADNERYIRKIADWLMMFIKDPLKWEKAIAPLILVLARTDIPVDYLQEFNIGKRVKRITAKAEELGLEHKEGIKNACANFEDWVKNRLIPRKRMARPNEPVAKKAKTEDVPPAGKPTETAGPSMMNAFAPPPAPAPAPTARPVRPSVKPESATAGPSTAPKPALPSFKPKVSSSYQPRAAAPAAPTAPSTNSLLAKTLQALNKTSAGSVSQPPIVDVPRAATASTLAKPNKKGHTVKFRDEFPDKDGLKTLREERVFTEEEYELEMPPWLVTEDGEHGAHGHTTHELDMDEGKMLRRVKEEEKEETIEWHEPEPYWNEPDPAGITPEMKVQQDRERGILSLPNPNSGPSPDESGVRIVENGPHTVIYSPFQSAPPPPAAAAVPNVGALLANLGNLNGLISSSSAPAPAPAQNLYGAQSHQGGYGYHYPTQGQGYPGAQAPLQSGWGGGGNNGYHPPPSTFGSGGGGGGYEREPKRARIGAQVQQSNRRCEFYKRGTCRYTAETCKNLHID